METVAGGVAVVAEWAATGGLTGDKRSRCKGLRQGDVRDQVRACAGAAAAE